MNKSWLIFCGLFSLVGISCSITAYQLWSKGQDLKSTGIESIATVIGDPKKKQSLSTTALAVIIQFNDIKRDSRIFYSTTFTSPVLFPVGEQIWIWYQQDEPDNVLM